MGTGNMEIDGTPSGISWDKFIDETKQLIELNFLKEKPVFDVGCGRGKWTRILIEMGYKVISVDAQEQFKPLYSNEFRVQRLQDLGRMEQVIAADVLEHVTKQEMKDFIAKCDKLIALIPFNMRQDHGLYWDLHRQPNLNSENVSRMFGLIEAISDPTYGLFANKGCNLLPKRWKVSDLYRKEGYPIAIHGNGYRIYHGKQSEIWNSVKNFRGPETKMKRCDIDYWTVSSEKTNLTVDSLASWGVKCNVAPIVVPEGEPYSHRMKVVAMIDYLTKSKKDIMCFVDAFDISFQQEPRKLMEIWKHYSSKGYRIVFGAECNCWGREVLFPNGNAPERQMKDFKPPMCFANSGFIFGERTKLLELCKKALALIDSDEGKRINAEIGKTVNLIVCDQTMFRMNFYGDKEITLDFDQRAVTMVIAAEPYLVEVKG